MGMSASQVRLLSLTSRLSDLEYQAQAISNSKIRLADSSSDAAKTYEDALNAKKLQVNDADTSNNIDATAYNLTTYAAVSALDKQRFLCDGSGSILVSQKVSDAFDSSTCDSSTAKSLQSNYKTLDTFLSAMGVVTDSNQTGYDASKVAYYKNVYSGKEAFLNAMGYTSATEAIQENDSNYKTFSGSDTNKYDSSATTYYSNVYDRMGKNGSNVISNSNLTDSKWLYDQLSSGNLSLSEWTSNGGTNGAGGWASVSYSSGDSSLSTAEDKSAIAKAEVAYETSNAKIQSQDKRYDLQLKQIDTEHNAIQTEMDSVKKVIDKNIERSFKIFDA